VHVPDERFDWLCNTYKPKSKIAAYLEVVDIAGLVKGASSGEGLGNAFLSHIRAVDGIFHVMRAFDDPDVIHVEDRIDPIEDIEIITNELRLKDIDFVQKNVNELKKLIPRGLKKEQKEELASAEKVLAWLESGKETRNGMDEWSLKDVDYLNERCLLSSKPVVYLVNLSPEDYARKKNKWLMKIAEWVAAHGGGKIIPFSGALESTLVDMPADEAAAHLATLKSESALPKIIKTGFSAIQLIYFFTAGEDEVKCWTLRKVRACSRWFAQPFPLTRLPFPPPFQFF
jgi:obg-like ATPase 1